MCEYVWTIFSQAVLKIIRRKIHGKHNSGLNLSYDVSASLEESYNPSVIKYVNNKIFLTVPPCAFVMVWFATSPTVARWSWIFPDSAPLLPVARPSAGTNWPKKQVCHKKVHATVQNRCPNTTPVHRTARIKIVLYSYKICMPKELPCYKTVALRKHLLQNICTKKKMN